MKVNFIFVIGVVTWTTFSAGLSKLDMLKVPYSDVEKDTIAGEVTVDQGLIPEWLNG